MNEALLQPASPLPQLRPALRGRLSRSSKLSPERDPLLVFSSFDLLPEATGKRLLGNGRTLLVHHPHPHPPSRPGLTVMTYNVLLGGQRRQALERYFAQLELSGRMPDVIALQEASQPLVVRLAERYGFNLAYFGRDEELGLPLVNGKAILSRHALLEAAHFTYGLDEAERQEAIERRGQAGELVEDRGALRAVVDVGGRRVAFYDVHHTLGDPGINANNLRQLNALVRQHRDGLAVVLGDFNANTLIHHDGLWPANHRLAHHHDTHTIQGYRRRYGHVVASVGDEGVGNIADRRVRRQLHELERHLPSAFARAPLVEVRLSDGSRVRPVEARAKLDPERLQKGSEAWLRLQDVADASTLSPLPASNGVVPATGKRFDNIFASPALAPTRLEVDQSTDASDHRPVIAAFDLRN